MKTASTPVERWSQDELTRAIFGETLTMSALFQRLDKVDVEEVTRASALLWVGSVGYERHKDSSLFAQHLLDAGIERLIDVRELPISRRRGYAKTALSEAMESRGIEYVHLKALGNPKTFRDQYKSGQVAEGRRNYENHLRVHRQEELRELVPLLRDKRSALMCIEHEPSVCHRSVILALLVSELELKLEIAELA